MKKAITGGEILNIHSNKNSVLYNTDDELKSIILEISCNPMKYVDMGVKAREYYLQNRQVKDMVNGITDAINYVMHK